VGLPPSRGHDLLERGAGGLLEQGNHKLDLGS